MEETTSCLDISGFSVIKRREMCPKCGRTFNLNSYAFFSNAENERAPYDVRIPESGYQVEPTAQNVVSVIIAGTPEIKSTVSLEEISRETEPAGLLRYAKSLYLSELASLRGQGASLIGGPNELSISGRPGFEITFAFTQTSIVVVGFWLEEDDAIFIFAKAPKDSNLRDKIRTLAQNITVNPT
jgi:hypothetical protein